MADQIWTSLYYAVAVLAFGIALNHQYEFFKCKWKMAAFCVAEVLTLCIGGIQVLNALVFLILELVLAGILTEGKIIDRVLDTMVSLALVAILEEIVSVMILLLADQQESAFINLLEITFVAVLMGIGSFLIHKKTQNYYFESMNRRNRFFCLIALLDSLFVGAIGRDILRDSVRKGVVSMLVIAMTILFVTIGYLVVSLIRQAYVHGNLVKENEIKEMVISEQKAVYDLLLEKNKETRLFRHDIKNHLIVLQLLLEKGKVEDATEYLEKMTKAYEKISVKQVYFGNEILDSLITMMCLRAKEKQMEIEVEGNIVPDKINIYDLCCIFTNAIGNAVEACERQNLSGPIHVKAAGDEQMQMIVISNPATQEMYQNAIHGISSKADAVNHGLGIKNIRNALSKNHGSLDYSWESEVLTMHICMEFDELSS